MIFVVSLVDSLGQRSNRPAVVTLIAEITRITEAMTGVRALKRTLTVVGALWIVVG